MKKSKLIALQILGLILNPQYIFADPVPQTISISGRLFNQDGSAPITDTVDFTLGVYDPSGTCLLYEETQSGINLQPTLGNFSLTLGSPETDPKRTLNDSGKSLSYAFSNLTTNAYSVKPTSCPNGYIPTAEDTRRIRLTVVNHGRSETLSPDEIINSVPYAISAQNIQGITPDKIIQDKNTVTQANLDILTNQSDASSLHNHDSTYVKLGSQPSFSQISITGTPSNSTDATNKSYIDALSASITAQINSLTSQQQQLSSTVTNLTSDQVAEGSNHLYFTQSRAQGAISVDSASPLSYSAGVLSLSQSSASTNGYLSKSDWSVFNNKQNDLGYTPVNKAGDTITGALTISNVLSMNNNLITNLLDPINNQDAATKNYIDGKVSALNSSNATINTQITQLSSQLTTTQSSLSNLTSDSVAEGSNHLYYQNSRARSAISADSTSPITYDATSGVIGSTKATSSTDGYLSKSDWATFSAKQNDLGYTPVNKAGDSMVGSFNVAPASGNSIPLTIKGENSQSANLLNLSDDSGTVLSSFDSQGRLSIPQTQSSDPANYAVSKGYVDSKVAAVVVPVTSVNGKTGALTLSTSDISEGSNLYYTDARAKLAVSALAPLSYSSTSGAFSIPQSTASANGYLSSSDFATFSAKVSAVVGSGAVTVGGTPTIPSISVSNATSSSAGLFAPSDYNKLHGLTSGNILVANSSGDAAAVSMSGDAIINSGGVVALKNTGSSGTYTKVTTDAQGRVASGSSLSASDIPAPAGDVQGTYSTTTVKGLQGVPLDSTVAAPQDSNILVYSAAQAKWVLNSIAGMLGYAPVNKAGDTMSGALNMGSGTTNNQIHNMADPSSAQDAATKSYVDTKVAAASSSAPAGTIIMFGGPNCPTGYVSADGSSYSKTTYPNLFAALTDSSTGLLAWGGNGTTAANSSSFNVPDMRGRFPRGVDARSSGQLDPDNASRSTSATNGNSGAHVGSVQGDALQNHQHVTSMTDVNNAPFGRAGSGFNGGVFNGNAGAGGHLTAPIDGNGRYTGTFSSETRPRNAYVNYCIATGS